MTEIEVQVLGPLRVLLDQRAARIKGGHQRTLLGRLVTARGAVVGTDRLIEDVWEGRPPPQAASVLQVQVHNLRRLLEPARLPRAPSDVLVSESGGYALMLGDDGVDAWSFEKAMQRYERLMRQHGGRISAAERHRLLDDALGRWHGTAFESFATVSWVSAEVSHLTELHATAVELRAEAAYELGRDLDIIATLPRQLHDNPGREESARLLALAQYRLGRQVDALATLRHTRDHLRTEFGIDPGHKLVDAEQAILAGTANPAVADSAPVLMTSEYPRTHPDPAVALHPSFYPAQVAALRLAAEAARQNGPRMVWVAGESGSGKTVLSNGIRSELEARGWTTAYATCPEVDGAPPAWPIRELLAELDASAPTDGDHFTVLRRVSERCRQLVASNPVVIFLDGAHCADLPTLQGLRQLLMWLSNKPILIIVTVRGSEAIAGMRSAGGRGIDSMSERVELNGVDIAGTREIARVAGMPDPSDSTVRALHERTSGSPLFIRLWVEYGAEYPLPAEPPVGIMSVLLERAERLPSGAGDILRHMAVWNSPIDVDTLSVLTRIAELEVVDLADRALTAGLIRSNGKGAIMLADEILRQKLYRDIAPIRRTRMHWQIVEHVGSRIGTSVNEGAELVALAGHALLGSTPTTAATAIEYLLAAADCCAQQGLLVEASRLWGGALPLCERASHGVSRHGDNERRRLFGMVCHLAEGLAHDGQHDDADALAGCADL